MLNYIWLALIVLAVLMGGFTDRMPLVSNAAIDSAKDAVTLALGLIAIMTLWLGLMRLAEKAGLISRLGLMLKPVMVWLFPEVPPEHPAMGAILMNMAANILGLNNAATPLGLRAMRELETLNRRPGIATNAMCMLLAINTSSITLIPVSVIALLAAAHSKNPTAIIGTSLAATAVAHAAAILACKFFERLRAFRLPPLEEAPKKTADNLPADAGLAVETEAEQADARPWVRGSASILGGAGFLFILMLVVTAFPELVGRPVAPEVAREFFAHRLIDSLSLLAVPWLILFFPLYAALRHIPVYDEFVEGGKEGFQISIRILPYIVAMLVAVGMFRAAGGMDVLTWLLHPLTSLLHYPPELVPLTLIRPFSGTGSYGLLGELIKNYGPDSLIALTAGTLYGCSETTFYVIAVYFGSVQIRKTRHAIPAGLVADVIGPVASVIICRMVFGG
jgi:spore maturation protein SpmA